MLNVRLDEVCEPLVAKAISDPELIAHVQPGRKKISASAMANAVIYEFLRRWYEKKEGERERN